jgi:hypothetical protein
MVKPEQRVCANYRHAGAIRPWPKAAIADHANWGLSGDTNREGMMREPREGIFTWVVRRHDAEWLIEASHNTNILDVVGPKHKKPATMMSADE